MVAQRTIVSILSLFSNQYWTVEAHGRFLEPPSRASMWRKGFNNPPDYNDNEGFCGGLTSLIRNKGCGICGDPLDSKIPRSHEAGGKYGNGIIVRTYSSGSIIDASVEITANHLGIFTFKLCPNNDISKDPAQSCFDNYPLKINPPWTSATFVVTSNMRGVISFKIKLPETLECMQCIIQWEYTAGNNWGSCDNGTSAIGCGTQETFRACSDVSIMTSVVNKSSTLNSITQSSSEATLSKSITTNETTTPTPSNPMLLFPASPLYKSTTTNETTTTPTSSNPILLFPTLPLSKFITTNETTTTPSTSNPITQSFSASTPLKFIIYEKTTPSTSNPTLLLPVANLSKLITYATTTTTATTTTSPNSKSNLSIFTTQISTYSNSKNTKACSSVGVWQQIPGMNDWCNINCKGSPPYCPSSHCSCL